ncbi:MAG TPA: Uma2 family endonuclease [Planctomycetota bacterium]|nr:Uma2 family endonuclease [Planctomycetota bacterium]
MNTTIEVRRSSAPRGHAPLRRNRIPPLENGATLDADEFVRRYKATPSWIKKAELIDGVVYMQTLVSSEWHAIPDGFIQACIGCYAMETPGVENLPNATIRLSSSYAPQPDGLLRVPREYGGTTHFDKDGCIVGPVEFVAEIAASSVSIDLGRKLNLYRDTGIQEYFAWRTEDNLIDWFYLESGKYVPLVPDKEGIVRSRVFPGLWLDIGGILKRDRKRVMATLKRGLKSAEHARFVRKLKAAHTK